MAHFVTKIGYAISHLYKSLCKTPHPRLVMTLLVKNEEQMLAYNIEYHHRMGVDAFIITDNNSTDHTPDIIKHYVEKGWVIEHIHETATNYEQKEWVDRMIWLAKTKHHADWVINADADEFWHTSKANLKEEINQTHANVLSCEMRSVYPTPNKEWTDWIYTVRYVNTPDKYDLSPYSVFEHQNKKVIHRTAGYIQISMGNHKVKMLPQNEIKSNIIVYHYNFRTCQHFMSKMINGGKQLEQHKGKHGGRHWRYYYALYKKDPLLLEAEYQRAIGANSFVRLQHDGFIYKDNPMPDIFKTLKKDVTDFPRF